MKKILIVFISLVVLSASCSQEPSQECKALETAKSNLENNIKLYATVWEEVFKNRDISLVNTDSFDSEVSVLTSAGKISGIDAFRDYYNNYLTGFSDPEFKIIDVFGQGDRIVKHWNFKGTHDGVFFGIPATNNKVDLYGTTLVTMKDGKVFQEEDFFDNHTFLTQLGLIE
tara:strand:- start:62 stop:574 length:513 start_codon:yes stop_codon:yes gene_type:complete